MLKFYVSSETFKILIRKKFSRSKWTWLSIFILLLNWVVRRIDADLSIAQIFLDNSCPLNFLIMIREDHVFGLLGPVS